MKNRFLSFFRTYRLCLLLSLIMVWGIFVSTNNADLFELGLLNFRGTYLILGLSILSLIYGSVSYIKTRRIWIPQLILCFVSFLYWFQFDITTLAWAGTYMWAVYPVIFSIIGASLTAFICFVRRQMKETWD